MLEQDRKQISRRDVIKAAGLVSLGLMYTKPFVETIEAKPAFKDYDRRRRRRRGNNGVGNGGDPQPPGNPPINDGPGTGPGRPGNQGGPHR